MTAFTIPRSQTASGASNSKPLIVVSETDIDGKVFGDKMVAIPAIDHAEGQKIYRETVEKFAVFFDDDAVTEVGTEFMDHQYTVIRMKESAGLIRIDRF